VLATLARFQSNEAEIDPFLNGAFGPHAFAVWPRRRLLLLSRLCFLSFAVVAAFSHAPTQKTSGDRYVWNIIRVAHLYHLNLPLLTRCAWTRSQSSLQLSLFLNNLRGKPPVIEGHGCLCRFRHPATAVSLPRSVGHLVFRFEPSLDRRFRNALPQRNEAQPRSMRHQYRFGDFWMTSYHGFSMVRCDP